MSPSKKTLNLRLSGDDNARLKDPKSIRQWYRFWADGTAIGQQPVAQLVQIPWGHNVHIVSKCQDLLSSCIDKLRNTPTKPMLLVDSMLKLSGLFYVAKIAEQARRNVGLNVGLIAKIKKPQQVKAEAHKHAQYGSRRIQAHFYALYSQLTTPLKLAYGLGHSQLKPRGFLFLEPDSLASSYTHKSCKPLLFNLLPYKAASAITATKVYG